MERLNKYLIYQITNEQTYLNKIVLNGHQMSLIVQGRVQDLVKKPSFTGLVK